MSSSNPFNFPRAHVRAQSDKIIQAQNLHESKTVASCVDTTNKLMRVDLASASGSHGLATEANQTTVINATLRDINNTGAIGDGSSQASAMCLGYDRSNGQGRSLLVDANGALETNVTMTAGHGLATEAKQDDIINATNRAINNTGSIGDGSTNATAIALGYDRTNGKGRAVLVDDGGRLDVNCLGNTVGDGSGDVKSLHLDGSGNVQTNIVNTVNIAPANSVNSGITNDPANSVAVGLRGRTDIADSSTETFILTDAQGHLQCDVLSSVGGDTRIKGNDGNDGAGTDRIIKTDANGVLIVDGSASTQPVEQSYSFGSEYTIISSQSIANGDSHTSGEFEIQSVKNIQTILSLSVSAGGSTNYDIDFEGSLNGTDFYEFPDATIFGTTDVIVSTESAGIVPVRYMKVKITNKHGSGSHTFTVNGSVLGATLAAP